MFSRIYDITKGEGVGLAVVVGVVLVVVVGVVVVVVVGLVLVVGLFVVEVVGLVVVVVVGLVVVVDWAPKEARSTANKRNADFIFSFGVSGNKVKTNQK